MSSFALQEPTRVEFVVVRVETGWFVLAEAGGYPISVSAAHMQARQLTDKSCRTRVVCLQAFIEGGEWHGVKTALIGPVNRNKRGNKSAAVLAALWGYAFWAKGKTCRCSVGIARHRSGFLALSRAVNEAQIGSLGFHRSSVTTKWYEIFQPALAVITTVEMCRNV